MTVIMTKTHRRDVTGSDRVNGLRTRQLQSYWPVAIWMFSIILAVTSNDRSHLIVFAALSRENAICRSCIRISIVRPKYVFHFGYNASIFYTRSAFVLQRRYNKNEWISESDSEWVRSSFTGFSVDFVYLILNKKAGELVFQVRNLTGITRRSEAHLCRGNQ